MYVYFSFVVVVVCVLKDSVCILQERDSKANLKKKRRKKAKSK